ncbi:hypothetical protein F4781DRAFT_410471 [Annulohypoxylon bovei var. microspora]|nr:hypothetical protein F4781DRAFT_410471 [Annulohypoxylon bovei var. microspora]
MKVMLLILGNFYLGKVVGVGEGYDGGVNKDFAQGALVDVNGANSYCDNIDMAMYSRLCRFLFSQFENGIASLGNWGSGMQRQG